MSKIRTEAKLGRAHADNKMIEDVLRPTASLNDFTQEFDVPAALLPAIMSGRPELVMLAQPTAMNADEVGLLYRMIGILLQTNGGLRSHAERLASMVEEMSSHLRGFQSTAAKIEEFAKFRINEDDVRDSEVTPCAA